MINFGDVPIGAVLPIPFATYAGSTGASVTLTGLATTDIEVYKGTTVTQRASDAGYALIDTDGIDIDGITGIHGFSIDTGDNTDAGFYVSGSYYYVVVSAITVDSQTVNFIAATFRCVTAEGVAGQPKVDTAAFGGSAGTFSGGRPEVNTTHAAGTAWNSGAIGASTLAADTIAAAKIAAGAITSAKFAAGAIDATAIATGAIDADALAADAVGEIADGVWDEAQAGHVGAGTFGEVATETAAIKAKTDNLPPDPADASDVAAAIAALNDVSAAEVNAEVVDALAVDTYAEPTGVPAATATLAVKIGRLHQALRNKITVTSTKKQFFDDADAALWEKDLSDDGTTYTESEGNAI